MGLMKQHNGVQFIENSFNYINFNGEVGESSIGFCAYGNKVGADDIYYFQDQDNLGYEKVIVFGLNGRGDYISFDYRQNPRADNPSIVIMYHDDYIREENGSLKMRIIKVAENFDDFLNMLHE